MNLSEYAVMFVLVAIMGAGIPGPGDASLIAAGALAGEGKLNIWLVLVTAGVAWMLGSVIGFMIGAHGGRPLLDHPGRLEKRRRKLLAKGDRAFGRYTFVASATLPAFVSGIFPRAVLAVPAGGDDGRDLLDRDLRRGLVLPGRGDRQGRRGDRREGADRRDRPRRRGSADQSGGVEVARRPAGATGRTGPAQG